MVVGVVPAPVSRVDVGERRLAALTFDDGPAEDTERVLDLLAAHGARATFFVLGRQVAGREETLRRALAEGHELGNHGWSHARADELSPEELASELERTSAAIEAATGAVPRLARPPYGAAAEPFAAAAWKVGMRTALWSVDPEDWRGDDGAAIARRVLAAVHPGAIVDLHDGWGRTPASRRVTVDALATLLPALAAADWRLVTVSESSSVPPERAPDGAGARGSVVGGSAHCAIAQTIRFPTRAVVSPLCSVQKSLMLYVPGPRLAAPWSENQLRSNVPSGRSAIGSRLMAFA